MRFARSSAVLAAAVLALPLTVSPATAAGTLFGSTFIPANACTPGITYIQSPSPMANDYTSPIAGVITKWRFESVSSPPTLKFKVFRQVTGASYTVIGSSASVLPDPNQVNQYDIRVPVQQGDVIGLTVVTPGKCAQPGSLLFANGDAAVGSTQSYTAGSGQLDVAAIVEVDADGDGYGDETQDACPSQATEQGACDLVAPNTRIKGKALTTTKRTVKARFSSDEAGSTFQCRLAGKAAKKAQKKWKACTSPKKYKNLKVGSYRILVRATDAAGNTDASPAKKKVKVVAKT